MIEELIALLREKPSDVDFSLLDSTPDVKFVRDYYERFGELPALDVFVKEMGLEDLPEVGPWAFYENKLKEAKFIREAVPVLERFNSQYKDTPEKALLNLRDNLAKLSEPGLKLEPVSIITNTDRYAHFKDIDNARIPTGIKPLDEACGGLSVKDEFAVITARLGIGKSWVAHYVAQSMVVDGKRVGLYSGEMSEDEVGARFDSLLSHVSNFALTRGKEVDLTEHLENLKKVREKGGEFLVLTPNVLKHNARPSDLKRFVKEYKLDVLLVDQLDLMEPDGGWKSMSDSEQKALLSYQLKSMQQELRVPLVLVHQLNREAAKQEADASNLAGSDRIGRDATLIIALARKDDTLKMKVLKARSFKIPDTPWEFTWDIDKGILEPKLSSMDSVKAKIAKAKAIQATKDAQAKAETQAEEDSDEIW